MLITCPECGLQASDKAMICPHCGFPLKESAARRTYRKSNKRKKLPNGFGRITPIRDKNLRKPFRAMVTVGKDEFNQPIGKILDYYETYEDAYAGLAEYNRNPYDLSTDITCKELHKRWSEKYYKTIGDNRIKNLELAWKYSTKLHNARAKEIRARHIKFVMEEGEYNGKKPSPNIAYTIKTLWNLMLDFALEYEIVKQNYARSFSLPKEISKAVNTPDQGHIIFTPDEMKILWEHLDMPYVDVMLIQCYSGWRPQELGLIILSNVDIHNWTFTGGIKTDAGRERTVPIHVKIRPLVKRWYDLAMAQNKKYLFFVNEENYPADTQLTYRKYQYRFKKVIAELGLNPQHSSHDPRKQFGSMAKESGVDPYAVKLVMGHSFNDDITEKAYTEVSLKWLTNEVAKIKEPGTT